MRRLETSRGQREGDMEKNDDEKWENKGLDGNKDNFKRSNLISQLNLKWQYNDIIQEVTIIIYSLVLSWFPCIKFIFLSASVLCKDAQFNIAQKNNIL